MLARRLRRSPNIEKHWVNAPCLPKLMCADDFIVGLTLSWDAGPVLHQFWHIHFLIVYRANLMLLNISRRCLVSKHFSGEHF